MRKKTVAITLIMLSMGVSLTGCNQNAEKAQTESNSEQVAQIEQTDEDKEMQESSTSQKNIMEKSDTEETNKTETIQSKSKILLTNMKDCKQELQAHKYENLSIHKNAIIQMPECCGKVVMKVPDDFNALAETLFQKYVGDTYNKKYWSDGVKAEGGKNYNIIGPEYDDKKNKIHMGIADNGYFMYEYDEAFSSGEGEKEWKDYYLTENYEDVTYWLKDGKMKLSEILEKADKEAHKWEEYQENINLKPYYVRVETDKKTGLSSIEISYQKMFNNASIFSFSPMNAETDRVSYLRADGMYIEVNSVKEPVSFIHNDSAKVYMQEEYDEMISFEQALELLNETLEGISVPSIKEAGLEYLFVNDEENGYDVLPGKEYAATPYWVVHFDFNLDNQVYATIDCKTGEVNYYQNGLVVRSNVCK